MGTKVNRRYCVVYLSDYGIHERCRCYAKGKGFAKRMCKEELGIDEEQIVEVYLDEYEGD